MTALAHRPWAPETCETLVQHLAAATAARDPAANLAEMTVWSPGMRKSTTPSA